jgi:putative exosortase-associated protein (TIGR04073 family)
MRKLTYLFAAVALAAGLTGCQGPEQKLARGISNTMEVVRWGDMRRSVEQNAIFSTPDVSYSYGFVHGFDQSVKRIGLGIFEVVTFPIPLPTYKPICTASVPANPQFPDSYKPGLVSSSTFDTDTFTGFSGGDVAPFIPGSRFSIFED